MKKKTAYRIRNWREYNRALKQRGSLTLWVSKDAIANWTTDDLTGEPGASPTYTDLAIETMATVQAIYRLAGRQTQGFLQSLFDLMKLELTVPDHSTLSRRRRNLSVTLPVKDWFTSRHLVVDSTGVKVFRRRRMESPPARLEQASHLAQAASVRGRSDARSDQRGRQYKRPERR